MTNERQLNVEPIISYPRQAQPGKTYLLTVDLRFSAEDWPYEEEEYPVHCMLDTGDLFNHEPITGNGAMILHRFGGSYGAAMFLLKAADEKMKGEIRVNLVNRWGLPVKTFEFSDICISQNIDDKDKTPVKPKPNPEKHRFPIKNPYVINTYVSGTPAFVGREYILQEVRKVLQYPQQNSILLYGQRHIGKTSILKELEAKLLQVSYYPIYFDLSSRSRQSLEDILQELVDTIHHALGKGITNLGNEPKNEFRNVWLPNLLDKLGKKSLVLLFDEFDVLDDSASKQTGNDFYRYLHDLLSMNSERLFFVFVIERININDINTIALSTILKNISSKRISPRFNREDTFKLVRLSETNKTLRWAKDAIEKVWQLTNGHLFLTKILCNYIWQSICNEEPNKTTPVVTLENVETAIINKTLEKSDNALTWLWDRLSPAERIVASAIADASAKIITESQLKDLLHESDIKIFQELKATLDFLQSIEIIENVEGGYRFCVELQRHWVTEHKPLYLEINNIKKEILIRLRLLKTHITKEGT